MKSLETESLTVAESRVLSVVAEWKAMFAKLQSGQPNDDAIAVMEREVAALEAKGWDDTEIYLHTQSVADDTEDYDLMEAVQVIFGGIIRTDRQIEGYLETLNVATKTKDMQRSDLHRFAKKFPYADEIKQSDVADWVEGDLMGTGHLSAPTCRRIISACRGYWRYMEKHHRLKAPPPFEGVVPAQRKAAHSAHKNKRKAFSRGDLHITPQSLLEGPSGALRPNCVGCIHRSKNRRAMFSEN
jgi:hypothetical protein